MWRPTVDPTGRSAVWWDGAVEGDPTAGGWRPRAGRLVLGTWPAPGVDPSARTEEAEDVLAAGPVDDWQARWDETGTRLAVWLADGDDPTRGLLSLYGIDPSTGRIDQDEILLEDAPALPDFSIGSGRLAWLAASEDGSSKVNVLAWGEAGIGQVELVPDASPLVIVR
jgi:hypothetical protein